MIILQRMKKVFLNKVDKNNNWHPRHEIVSKKGGVKSHACVPLNLLKFWTSGLASSRQWQGPVVVEHSSQTGWNFGPGSGNSVCRRTIHRRDTNSWGEMKHVVLKEVWQVSDHGYCSKKTGSHDIYSKFSLSLVGRDGRTGFEALCLPKKGLRVWPLAALGLVWV